MNKFFINILAVLVLAVGFLTVNAQKQAEAANNFEQNSGSGRLDGTWLATVTFPDGFALKVLFTFAPGRDATEGTLIDQNEYQLTPNPVCTADQGAWRKTPGGGYIATHLAFCFDATDNYAPAGSVKVRDEIRVSRRGDTFTGRQFIEIYDVDGNQVDQFEAAMEAVRVQPEAPPESSALTKPGANPLIQKFGRFPARKTQE
jgi:hypothetical protein